MGMKKEGWDSAATMLQWNKKLEGYMYSWKSDTNYGVVLE